jgi:hypothetical protein
MENIDVRQYAGRSALTGAACLAAFACSGSVHAGTVRSRPAETFVAPAASAAKTLSACTGASGFFFDPLEGTTSAATDFSYFSWTLADGQVAIALSVPFLTQQVEVDRPGINGAFREYAWGVAIDVDDNTATGASGAVFYGADYEVVVSYFHQSSTPRLLALESMQHDVWRYVASSETWQSTATEPVFARPPFDPTYLDLSAAVPGVSAASRLIPYTLWFDPSLGGGRLDILSGCVPTTTLLVFRSSFEG